MLWAIIKFILGIIFGLVILELLLHWILWRSRVIQRNMRRREKERHARSLHRAMHAKTKPQPMVLTEEEEYAAYRAHW